MSCIEVSTGRSSTGYGITTVTIGRNSKVVLKAHRVAFEQAYGVSLGPRDVVRHTCDNRWCVNPLHLMIGTQGDNIRDMVDKGRHTHQKRTHCLSGLHELVRVGNRRRCPTCDRWRRNERARELRQLLNG